jgi:tRNA (guanine26-N2/guanine27-N2)-dimethyltransferase
MFLDGAVQAVKDGGVLQVTCTDLLTLCGAQPEVCFRKYGSVPLKMRACHENAIRIALAAIAGRAHIYNRYIEPLFSVACIHFHLVSA